MARRLLRLSKENIGIIVNLTVISALLIAVTCVLVNKNFSFGWFGLNRVVKANNISMSVQDKDNFSIEDYTVYRYDQDDNLQTDKKAIMRQYDSIFVERNDHNAVVIKIDVDGLNAGDIFGINIVSTQVDDNDPLRYISDVVSLRASAMYIPPTDDVYDTVTSELMNSIYPSKTFRTIDAENVSTRTTVVTIDSLTMVENGAVYILMDYDPDLIGHVEVEFGTESDMLIVYNGNITKIELFRS